MRSDNSENTTDHANNEQRPSSRRRFLTRGVAGAAGLAVAGTATAAWSGVTMPSRPDGTTARRSAGGAAAPGPMPDPAPANLEQGGGKTYHSSPGDSPRFVVDNLRQLKNALSKASDGDIIRVSDDAVIDLTGEEGLAVPSGVILSGGRGNDGSKGGLLYTTRDKNPDEGEALPMFLVRGDRVRFSGLRLQGPRLTDYWDPDPDDHSLYDHRLIGGIHFLGSECRVDNCQLYGFTHAAISVGAKEHAVPAQVDHCSIHNNPMEHYGYGVNLYNGRSTVEWNYFDYNRHSIAGFGYRTNGFVARYNLVGGNPISHAFDMHGLSQNTGGDSKVAGGRMQIYRNTFRFTEDVLGRDQEAIAIRGIPDDRCDIDRNWFHHGSKPAETNVQGNAYRQENDRWMHIWASDNHFGTNEPAGTVGHPR